ncbi:cytochrome-c peroxidase [Aliiroseovarius sp. S1339]|uniref:cytochrome-c peroxidase n=1 Tax=Aliiroseovarius sp. S1339 TaxID=2936990 RepID=UPI0020BE8985|nr:cytochrome c peroxidase [Aliiroseovarius sp. S1339]MCK8464016.1 cytochrome-c peroxidase [Aliiroseovarius sp. S1339]
MKNKAKQLLGQVALISFVSTAAMAQDVPPLATLGPAPIPADNPMTPEKIALGEKLFWDGRLSGNGAMPCSACHLPDAGWGTATPISFGYPGTQHWRNSQTIVNSAYYNKLFWDGASRSLELQAKAAAGGGVAGNGDGSMMEMRLRFVPEYVAAFKEVFGTVPHISAAWMAIAAYERTIVTDATKVPFDRFLAGDETAMSDEAKRGMELFNGKANCISCHNGALVSDQKFYNIGVPAAAEFEEDPLYQITLRWELYQKGGRHEDYKTGADDLGLYHQTKRPDDKHKFRTPSLRELRWTEPFMHNGGLETLADVVAFYNAGGGEGQTAGLTPLGLSSEEEADLVAFLEALSMDEPLLLDEPELPETNTWAEFAK